MSSDYPDLPSLESIAKPIDLLTFASQNLAQAFSGSVVNEIIDFEL